MKNKTIVNGQENMPLANDFSKKKSNYSVDEVETSIKIMDTKDMPNNNIFIIEKKKEFVMPVKVEDFARYFESAFKSGQLKKEYSVSVYYIEIIRIKKDCAINNHKRLFRQLHVD